MDRIILTTSLAPYLDRTLCPGAVRCLGLLRSLAGKDRKFATLTSSIATQLERCKSTIRNYRDQLVSAGYIWWVFDRRSGCSTIMIRSAVEPPSRRAALLEEELGGGAQFVAPIKTSKKIKPPYATLERLRAKASGLYKGVLRPSWVPQAPIRTVQEQIAFCLAHAKTA